MVTETNHLNTDFRKLFESAPGLFIVLKPDFTIDAVSDAYLKAGNVLRENILGKKFFEVFPDAPSTQNPSGLKDVRESLEKVLRDRQPDTMTIRKYEMPVPESKGGGSETKFWGSINIPVTQPNGEITHIIRRVEDMTALMQQQGEYKIIEEERDLFFKYSFDLLAMVGSDGYFKRLNPAFERTLGYTEQELCAKPIVEFLHPEDVAKTKRGIQTLAGGTPTISSINRYLCKDGQYKWLSWNTIPVGSVFYTVGRDITEQMQAEERIRDLNRDLEKKNIELEAKNQERLSELNKSEAQVLQLQKMDAIGRLAGGIAHDFNNMLGAINLYCDLLSDDEDTPAGVRKSCESIRNVTEKAAALTRQLLIFSRNQIVQSQTINLNPIIKQLEKMLTRLIGENIQIVIKIASDLKPVSADPSQMEQILLNLVVNARDAMPTGGNITIQTSNIYLDEVFTSTHLSVNPGEYVLLSVSDSGVGMDAATISRIFEPFFSTKPVGKGTGLGLSTTYGIVKQNKGTIWVYSEPGKGTVFKIYLPIVEQAASVLEIAPVKIAIQTGTETILLAEDDEGLRQGFCSVLERGGYRVLVAADGKEALEICESHVGPIHLLMTDMVMPKMGGFELSKKVLALRQDIRVLYMSGYTGDTLDNFEKENSGPLEFLQKPFGISALLAKVRDVLKK